MNNLKKAFLIVALTAAIVFGLLLVDSVYVSTNSMVDHFQEMNRCWDMKDVCKEYECILETDVNKDYRADILYLYNEECKNE